MGYKLEPIPRNDKGVIKLDEYREQLWYRQERMIEKLAEINGTVERHNDEIRTITTYGKVLGVLWGLVIGFIGVIWKVNK